MPDKTTESFQYLWFHSGDLAKEDAKDITILWIGKRMLSVEGGKISLPLKLREGEKI